MSESWSKHSQSLDASREYHRRYFVAVSNAVRKEILEKLAERPSTAEELSQKLGLPIDTINYHLQILEWGFCVTKDDQGRYTLTKEGRVIDYLGERSEKSPNHALGARQIGLAEKPRL